VIVQNLGQCLVIPPFYPIIVFMTGSTVLVTQSPVSAITIVHICQNIMFFQHRRGTEVDRDEKEAFGSALLSC
jgi:hypothetical protein